MHGDDRSVRKQEFAAFLEGRIPRYEAEFRLTHGHGQWVWVRECAQALERDETGGARRVSGLLLDITARKMAEARAEHLARHDALTGLANRNQFDDGLTAAIDEANRTGKGPGLVLIDLDNFKRINDTFGRLAGDEVLRIVASRIRSAIRGRDTACCFGGDEFAVVLTTMRGRDDVEAAVARLRSAVVQPARLAAGETEITASFGYAIYPDEGSSAELLFACADRALYADKHGRRPR